MGLPKKAYSGGNQHMRGFFDQIDQFGKDLEFLRSSVDKLQKVVEKLDTKLDKEVEKVQKAVDRLK